MLFEWLYAFKRDLCRCVMLLAWIQVYKRGLYRCVGPPERLFSCTPLFFRQIAARAPAWEGPERPISDEDGALMAHIGSSRTILPNKCPYRRV